MTTTHGAIRVRDVRMTYRRNRIAALQGVHLDVGRGERVALLGPNGAGKTTLTHVMLGLLRPDTGEVLILGKTPHQALRAGQVGAMLQETGLMRYARVGELVRLASGLYGRGQTADSLLDQVGLAELRRRAVSSLSGGERQRLKLALALAGEPSLLFLDEPTVALDVEARRRFWEVLEQRAAGGAAVLFTTHYLQEAERFADRVVVINAGKIVADGSVGAVRSARGPVEIAFRAPATSTAELSELPGVLSASQNDDRSFLLTTRARDETLEALYRTVDKITELEIRTTSFEQAVADLFQQEA